MRIEVSVVIPARNGALTLADPIDFLWAQSHDRWEAIIVDNGSTDETAAIAADPARADPRIRFVRHEPKGVGGARNRGLQLARYPWILFLDADDQIKPTHLEKLTA